MPIKNVEAETATETETETEAVTEIEVRHDFKLTLNESISTSHAARQL